MMRAILCERWCDVSDLRVHDVASPPLRPGTVRIRVAASGVSWATQLVVSGRYQRKPPLPFVPGTEIAGEVIEVAPGVQGLEPGMRVFAVLDWGGLAQEAVADAIHVMPLPDGLDKHATLHARGAELVLDSALPFRDAVREATGGVDLVIDSLGGAVFDESLRCLCDGGIVVSVGFAAGSIPQLPVNLLLLKNVGVAGLNWGSYVGWSPGDGRGGYAPRVRALWAQLLQWWQDGKIAPTVHARYPLHAFAEAMAQVRDRHAIGRVIVLPQETG